MKRWRDYILHIRPKAWSPAFVFVLTGYAASPYQPDSLGVLFRDLILLYIIYGPLLFGGTCALNSSQDSDSGPLNFLESPPAKPPYLGVFGVILMLLGVGVAALMNRQVFLASIAAFMLSLFYSWRLPFSRRRGKSIGGVDLVIDALGCGVVAVWLGWGATGAPFTLKFFLIATAFTITVAGSYPATQVFQLTPADDYASAKNFSTLLGPAKALRAGTYFLLIGFALISVEVLQGLLRQGQPMTYLGYFGFLLLFMWGVHQCWQWHKNPFKDSARKFSRLIYTLLGARLFWIFAEWGIK